MSDFTQYTSFISPPSPLFFPVSPHKNTQRPQLASQQPACIRACFSMLDDGLSVVLWLTRHVCKCISAAMLGPLNAQLQQTWPSIDTAALLYSIQGGAVCLWGPSVFSGLFKKQAGLGIRARQTRAWSEERWWLDMVSERPNSLT